MLLLDSENHPRLVLPMYVWFQVLDDGWILLCVPRYRGGHGAVGIQLIRLDKLRRITDLDSRLSQIPEPTHPIFSIEEEFQTNFEFDTALSPGRHALDLPPNFLRVPEIYIISDNPFLPAGRSICSYCIYVVNPDQGTVEVLAQDWFNEGDVDFGYQWITRVAREPTTGRLVGDGIRIDCFVLDETGRNLVKHYLPAGLPGSVKRKQNFARKIRSALRW